MKAKIIFSGKEQSVQQKDLLVPQYYEKLLRCCTASAFYFNADERPALNREAEAGRDQLTFFPALHEHLYSEEVLEVCVERKIVLQELVQDEKVQSQQVWSTWEGLTGAFPKFQPLRHSSSPVAK